MPKPDSKRPRTSPSTPTPSPSPKDPDTLRQSTGEAHFRALEATLRALPDDAATTALGVAAHLEDPAVRARFASLSPRDGYDPTCVDRLAPAAWDAWYARHRFLAAQGVRRAAQRPEALRTRAMEFRTRRRTVAHHNLDDDSVELRWLDQIDDGRGDRDLANDRVALADVDRDHDALLKSDRFQVAKDPADARAQRPAGGRPSGATVAIVARRSAGPCLAIGSSDWRRDAFIPGSSRLSH